MPRRSASAIPLICWWSFPLPTSPISSGRPSPSCRSRVFCPSSPTSSDTPTSSKTPPCSTTGWPPEPMSKSTRAHCWILQNCAGRSASSSRGSLSTSSRRTPTPWTNARPGWQKPLLFWKRSWAERLPQSFCRTATHFSTMRSWMFSLPTGPKSHTFSLTIHPFRGILSQAGQKGSSRTALSGPHPGAVRRRPVTPLLRCTVFLSTSIKPVWIFTA